MPRFLDDDAMGDMLFTTILGSAFRLTAHAREQTLFGYTQKNGRNSARVLEPTRCLRRVNLFRRLIFGYKQIRIARALLFENINSDGIIGQVGIVDAGMRAPCSFVPTCDALLPFCASALQIAVHDRK